MKQAIVDGLEGTIVILLIDGQAFDVPYASLRLAHRTAIIST